MTAAIVLTAVGVPAAARPGMINITGLFYLDRNGNNAYDAGDSVRPWGPGVRITNQDTKRSFDVAVGADGRYGIFNLTKGPTYLVENLNVPNYSTTKLSFTTTETVTDGDFPLQGHVVKGLSFVDTNRDGVKQADEKVAPLPSKVSGKALDGTAVDVEATLDENGEYSVDLPAGDFTFTAPDIASAGLVLAEPKAATDIDWVSGTRKLTQNADNRTQRVDVRYFTPKPDVAVDDAVVTPAKDTYTLGEQVEIKVTLSNKGDVPVAPSFVMANFGAKLLKHSDNVKLTDKFDLQVNDKILPGKQVDVVLKTELNDITFTEVWPVARFTFGNLQDVNRKNNSVRKPIKVVDKTAPTSPSETTAPPTTTTTQPAVAQAGNKSGLAKTGAAPLGALALGGLLLAAGAGALLVARRRRS
ncbi:MSCRAMM family adhesin SdrC [Lentzea alba]|uniref:LPXTG cell wall anchor domain-containing protein n=1 Tax=Lentzea alba TaxID=2714351 RepID=UPI0039BF5FDE